MTTVTLKSSAGKWIMSSAILASAMAFIDATALNVVLPALQKSLNATGADLFWILNAYLLMLASLIIIGGSMGDKLGRKKVFMAGIFIFIGGSVTCGFATGVTWLICSRLLQGLGGALMIPGSLSLISSSITAKERGKAIGTWSAITTVVTMGGPVLGGALADAGLWRYIFFINVPIGIVALLILAFKVPESRDEDSDKSLDIPGAAAMALGLALITFGFLRVPALGIGHWQVYGALGLGVLVMIAFIIIEGKSRRPMMPLQLFSSPTFTGANLLTFFLYAALGSGMLFLGLNMVQVQGYSQLQSGLTFLPFTVLMISIARFAGGIADRRGPRLMLTLGPAVAGVGFLVLSFVRQTEGPSHYWTTFFPGILIFGLGMSFTVAPLTATVMGSVSDHYSGTASGINNALTRIANVFANAVFGMLAVVFFSGNLQKNVDQLHIQPKEKQAVMAQAANLGNAKVPELKDEEQKIKVARYYQEGFIDAYVNIMRISAVLAFMAAAMTLIFVRNKTVKDQSK